MDTYRYLIELVSAIESTNDRAQLRQIRDELEHIYDGLDPDYLDLAADVMARLARRLDVPE